MSKRGRWQRDARGGRRCSPLVQIPEWMPDGPAAALALPAAPGGTVQPGAAQAVRACEQCAACCCRLEVLLTPEDRIPAHLTCLDAWGGRSMAREADGWCVALHRDSLRCSIYAWRPFHCRAFEMGGADCQAVQQDLLAGAG